MSAITTTVGKKQLTGYFLTALAFLLLVAPGAVYANKPDSSTISNDAYKSEIAFLKSKVDSLEKAVQKQDEIWQQALSAWNHSVDGMSLSLGVFQIMLVLFSIVSGAIAFFVFKKFDSAMDYIDDEKNKILGYALEAKQAKTDTEYTKNTVNEYKADAKNYLDNAKAHSLEAYGYTKDLRSHASKAELAMQAYDRLGVKVQNELYKVLYPRECQTDEDVRKKIEEVHKDKGSGIQKIVSETFEKVRQGYVTKTGKAVPEQSIRPGINHTPYWVDEKGFYLDDNGKYIINNNMEFLKFSETDPNPPTNAAKLQTFESYIIDKALGTIEDISKKVFGVFSGAISGTLVTVGDVRRFVGNTTSSSGNQASSAIDENGYINDQIENNQLVKNIRDALCKVLRHLDDDEYKKLDSIDLTGLDCPPENPNTGNGSGGNGND